MPFVKGLGLIGNGMDEDRTHANVIRCSDGTQNGVG